MTKAVDVKDIYDQLQSCEDTVLGFLADPSSAPDFATDLLASLNTGGFEQALLSRMPQNPTFSGAGMQSLVDKVNGTLREAGIRSMTRAEYYQDASEERQEEKERLSKHRITTLQYLLGKSKQQRG